MAKNYKPKETVLVITVGLLLLYILFRNRIFLYSAVVVGLAGVLSFYVSEKIDWVWNKVSVVMGGVSNRVLLALVFFFVVMPVGLIRRFWKKKRLTYFDRGKTTNFSEPEKGGERVFGKKDLENMW
ncbi:MAG TPA: hypothetical protein VK518_23535 [Puia sp.]|nr:hypothetical protein [Puia sp.]